MHSQAKSSGMRLPESSWGTEGIRSKLETRKTTFNIQTRHVGEATSGSRKSWIEKEIT